MTENICGSQAIFFFTDKSTYNQCCRLPDLEQFQNRSHHDSGTNPYFKGKFSNKICERSVHKSMLSQITPLKDYYALYFLSYHHRISSHLLINYTTGSTTVHGIPNHVRDFRIKILLLASLETL